MRYRFFKDARDVDIPENIRDLPLFSKTLMINNLSMTFYCHACNSLFFEIDSNYQIGIGFNIHDDFFPKDYRELWEVKEGFQKVKSVIMLTNDVIAIGLERIGVYNEIK